MNAANYPCRTTLVLRRAVKWLNKNKRRICQSQEDAFDYPDYWNMPISIRGRLLSDEVDWIQEETYEWWSR